MLKGSNDPRHNEVHIGTNCVGPCLLFKLFLPILTKTAACSSTGSVRVIWAGSIAIEVNAPKPGGMEVDDTGRPRDTDELSSYGQSKVGNVFLARTYAKTTPETGVVHAAFNPGNLRSELQRHWHGLDLTLMVGTESAQHSLYFAANIHSRATYCSIRLSMAHTLNSGRRLRPS